MLNVIKWNRKLKKLKIAFVVWMLFFVLEMCRMIDFVVVGSYLVGLVIGC
jgi:hypothetical protein